MAVPPESLTFDRLEIGDNEGVDDIDGDDIELAKKSGKLKGQNLAKSSKLSKSRKLKGEKSKKPPKSRNSHNFNNTKVKLSFLKLNARIASNCLRLAFIKVPIF